MSRTYRRKHGDVEEWWLTDTEWTEDWKPVKVPISEEEVVRRRALYHSDKGYYWHNWRGPSWFHREYTQCPYRRECRDLMQKFLKEEIEDIIVLSKPKRECWD